MSYLDEEEFGRWIRSSLRTLESASRDLEAGDYSWACFKAHQAVEKALRALLWGIGRPRVGHSLVYILNYLAESAGIEPPEAITYACATLSKYYTTTRYLDVWRP